MKSVDYTNNESLIESLKQGDQKAFAYLMDQYHHRLCVYVNSLANDHYASEDIVQNVFLRLWERRGSLKSERSIKFYLYKSAYNDFVNQYNRASLFPLEKRYHKVLTATVMDDDTEHFENMLKTVDKEIQKLPPKCREVFVLSKKEGLTNLEISEHLHVSVKTVESQMTKAFAILRKSLKEKIQIFNFLLFGYRRQSPL